MDAGPGTGDAGPGPGGAGPGTRIGTGVEGGIGVDGVPNIRYYPRIISLRSGTCVGGSSFSRYLLFLISKG